jgi:integrase
LLSLRIIQVSSHLTVRQAKTGSPVAIQLRPETLQAIQRQTNGRAATEPVWPLWGRREAFYRAFRKLVAASGIRKGTFRWLRRTAATQVEIVAPGRATELLGHQSRSTTESWYLDRSQLGTAPLPPL